MAVGGGVQLRGSGHPLLGEVELLPVDGGGDPVPGGGGGGAFADQGEEPGQVGGPVDGHAVHAVSGEDQMGVGVVEGGQHGRPGCVDDLGGGADQSVQAVRVGGQGGDPVAGDGDGAPRRLAGDQGVHGGRAHQQVGGGLVGLRGHLTAPGGGGRRSPAR